MIVAALLAAGSALAGLQPLSGPAFGADETVTVSYPADGATVGAGPLTATGSVHLGTGALTKVVYAVDVSGSTAAPTDMDCDGDGGVAAADDDFNQDGSVGDTLDCEISGIIALNAALRAVPGSALKISVGIVGFGDDAAVADMELGDADTAFVAPGDTRDGRDVIPRVNAVAGSLTRGTIGLETTRTVGTGTDFQRPLDVAVDALTGSGNKWIFLLSDGQAAVPDTSAVVAAGVRVRTFAVGDAATCEVGSPLERIATATGDACVRVEDPSRLQADIITGTPAAIRSVTGRVDGGSTVTATVDAIGNWSMALGAQPAGAHTLEVRAELADGTTVPASVRFTVKAGVRYVALGDSFSSGEGVEPYVDQKVDKVIQGGRGAPPITLYQQKPAFLCHRSSKGWPLKIAFPGQGPVAKAGSFTFEACSGARLVNVDTQQFKKDYRGKATLIPLQNLALGTDVDLVTMSFGGNDVGFVPILEHCASQLNCWRDTFVTLREGQPDEREISLDDWTRIRIALLGNELDGLYQQVRSRVRPDTRIVVATYPRLLKVGNRLCTEGAVLAQGERQWLADRVDDFAELVHDRAGRSDVQVADVRDEFDGHAVCDGPNWIDGLRPLRSTDLGGVLSAASFHPNEKGTDAYARVVSAALAEPNPATAAPEPFLMADAGGTTAKAGQAPPADTAVRAAAAAEAGATPGPVNRTPSRAVRALTAAPAGTARIAKAVDPVLDAYPDDVIAAVADTRLSAVVLGDGAAMKRLPSCAENVVGGEHVPFAADGFAPGSTVRVRVAWEGRPDTTDLTVQAGADGRAVGWLRIPTEVPVGEPGVVEVEGVNAERGKTFGAAAVSATSAPACVQKVQAAGLLAAPTTPPPVVDETTPSAEPSRPAPSGPAPGGALPQTGTGRWLPIAALTGTLLVGVGLLLVLLARRRRLAAHG